MRKEKRDFQLIAAALGIMFGALLYLTVPSLAHADPVLSVNAQANGIWVADDARPSDFEVGGGGAASLSPHISAVGGIHYGVAHSYVRGSVGGRFTITDASDPNFSIGLGASYNACSEPRVHPEEWTGDAAVSWRPWPAQLPQVHLVMLGQYGFDTSEASLVAGATYAFRLP